VTSSPNNTATTSVNTVGTIKVEARRTDSNFKQEITININRPLPTQPTLSGSAPTRICSGQTISLQAQGAQNADSYTWETTGGVRVEGQTVFTGGSNAGISATSGGVVRVKSNSNACQTSSVPSIDRTVFFGVPIISNKTVNGSTAQSVNYTNGTAQLVLFTDNSADGANWSIVGGGGNIFPNSLSCYATFNSFLRVQAQTFSNCGNGESYVFYLIKSGSGFRIASPNPTNSTVEVAFEYPEVAEDLLDGIALYNEKGKVVKDFDGGKAKKDGYFKIKKSVVLDVSSIDKGTYYLHIAMKENTFKERIIVQ
jgi:hypothetical protein